jgi:tetratricopeptide (TPR) repeat protein
MMLPDWVLRSRWLRLGLQAVAVVLVVALVGAGAWAWYRSQESRGLAALADATRLAQLAEGPQASSEARARAMQALEGVLTEYPRLSAAPQAAYQLGNLKYGTGQHVEARKAYELALAKGASGTVRALAGMGIGYTWEAEKNYANAAGAYDTVLKQLTPRDFLYEEALTAEARAQERAGKPAVALDLYQRMLREVPDSRRADELRSRIASLERRVRPQ